MERREFLAGAAVTAAPLFVPESAFGANDRITFGAIATGGRGRYVASVFKKFGAECLAVCDVYEPNLEKAREMFPDAKPFVDYHDVLAQKVDAVLLAGPDHHHCPMLLAALDAKKDVYTEKPLSKSLEDSLKMVKAVRSTKQVVQVGMQRRSSESVAKAKKLVDDGILGDVYMVKPMWNWNIAKPLNNTPLPGKLDWARFLGDAPKRELEPMRFRNWRYFWDYAGGNMTDQGTHLMDVVQWFTKSGPPDAAISQGMVAKMKGAEHADVFTAVFQYPERLVTWSLDYDNAYQNGWSITFMGDKGTMIMDETGYAVYAEPWKKDAAPIYEERPKIGLSNAEAHVQNFLDCIKTRNEPNCPIEVAAQAVAGPHLANIALVQKKEARLPQGYLKA